jgi:hypothetical protein
LDDAWPVAKDNRVRRSGTVVRVVAIARGAAVNEWGPAKEFRFLRDTERDIW